MGTHIRALVLRAAPRQAQSSFTTPTTYWLTSPSFVACINLCLMARPSQSLVSTWLPISADTPTFSRVLQVGLKEKGKIPTEPSASMRILLGKRIYQSPDCTD